MSSAPVLDAAFGLHCVAGNETLYRKLLGKFADQQARVATDIRAALDAGTPEETARAHALTHTLKGVAASLGLTRLGETATAMDAQYKAGNDMAPLLPQLAANLEETLRAVADYLGAAG